MGNFTQRMFSTVLHTRQSINFMILQAPIVTNWSNDGYNPNQSFYCFQKHLGVVTFNFVGKVVDLWIPILI